MGDVVQFRSERAFTVHEICVQVSRYPQTDGSGLYCVEVLFPDGTWDTVNHSKSMAQAWKLAGKEAGDRRCTLLPESLYPGRSHKPYIGTPN
jgi:hypothetical protein